MKVRRALAGGTVWNIFILNFATTRTRERTVANRMSDLSSKYLGTASRTAPCSPHPRVYLVWVRLLATIQNAGTARYCRIFQWMVIPGTGDFTPRNTSQLFQQPLDCRCRFSHHCAPFLSNERHLPNGQSTRYLAFSQNYFAMLFVQHQVLHTSLIKTGQTGKLHLSLRSNQRKLDTHPLFQIDQE